MTSADMVHRHGQSDWHTHTPEDYSSHQQPIDTEKGPMPVIKGHPAQLTDGYHTMEEVYDHRRALTATLAVVMNLLTPGSAWRSKAHHPDDSPMFEGGYFIVGIILPTGTITYHYKLTHWDDFAQVPKLDHAPKWDGATPGDTVTRLTGAAQGESRAAAPDEGGDMRLLAARDFLADLQQRTAW